MNFKQLKDKLSRKLFNEIVDYETRNAQKKYGLME